MSIFEDKSSMNSCVTIPRFKIILARTMTKHLIAVEYESFRLEHLLNLKYKIRISS